MENILRKLLLSRHRETPPTVLICAAECSPYSKTGGLADVAGALPGALISMGFDARVITPWHRCIKEKYEDKAERICTFEIHLGWRKQYVGVRRLCDRGFTCYFIENDYYFGDKIYRGGLGEGEQYAFFQRAVMEAMERIDFVPEVIHCNDWHTAMIPWLVKHQYQGRPQGKCHTVLTIHNIAFQGKFGFDFVSDLLEIDWSHYNSEELEHYGCANFLKAGCKSADKITTVSPTYVRETLTEEYGEGLQGVLSYRSWDYSGIINGLDTVSFDPASDGSIVRNYSADDLDGKRECKQALIHEFGLDAGENTPLIGMVSRITSQKGFSLVTEKVDEIVSRGACLVILGSGEPALQESLADAQRRHPGKVATWFGYSEPMSRRIYSGCDFLLMPSMFEPCGLSQMIAMRYGTVPIVRETGGLRDTVQPYNAESGEGNGFSFSGKSADSMMYVIHMALNLYYENRERFSALIQNGMMHDWSFSGPSLDYAKLFISISEPDSMERWQGAVSHDPLSYDARVPFGAVRTGSRVTINVRAREDIEELFLVLGEEEMPMERIEDSFSLTITAPEEPQVLRYGFRLAPQVYFGERGIATENAFPFLLTVYDKNFTVPEWTSGAVMYQIFPDRFCRKGSAPARGKTYHESKGRTIELHASASEPVKWQAQPGQKDYEPNDFYGGTLSGIEDRLLALKGMGVDVIYLNPIFESCSNHRYNTADYSRVDPMLGSEKAFQSLCEKAESLGIHIILDGVFSHTGSDSIYFDEKGVYGNGALIGPVSPYYSWYDFRHFPDDYRCWWNFKSLPETNEEDPAWQKYIITGRNSIIRRWLRKGSSGWRLDVADELPDDVIENMRTYAKEEKPDAFILGEVWENAVTKESYGHRRTYALGRGLDSVMNYPFRNAVINFALGKSTAEELCRFFLEQKAEYPAPMYNSLMNLLGSHDTVRLRTVLCTGSDGSSLTRKEQAELQVTPEQEAHGMKLQKMCAALQFIAPGMPSVYYGDEEGMQGYRDPFCRGMYTPGGEKSLKTDYAGLGRFRSEHSAVRNGESAFSYDENTFLLLRYDASELVLLAVNNGESEQKILPCISEFRGASAAALASLPAVPEISVPAQEAVMVSIKIK